MNETLYISSGDMQQVFCAILKQRGFSKPKAERCAGIFTANSLDGVYSHGVNRFPRFVQYIEDGYIQPEAEPSPVHRFGALEQWTGNLGPGPLNAVAATERVMELAGQHGIGCIGLGNTNHWMRGGYYGWQAAQKGFVFIGWSNTLVNMPAWGALDRRLGNNPLVLALPFENEAVVLDMALSQYSFGALEQAKMKGAKLPVYGGFNQQGEWTKDPAEILESKRPMPIGYWKGAGLALLLDVLAAILSAGLSTHHISQQPAEYGLSQVFIAIDLTKLSNHPFIETALHQVIADYKSARPEENSRIRYPGEGVVERRKENEQKGIPVLKEVWESILRLQHHPNQSS